MSVDLPCLHEFTDSLASEADLYLRWKTPATLDVAGHDALLAFRFAIEMGDDHYALREAESDIEQALFRVNTKLDLLLNLMSRMLSGDPHEPFRRGVRLNPLGVAWQQTEVLPRGQHGQVSLRLEELPMLPIELPATLAGVEPRGHGFLCTALFNPLPRELKDLVQRYIFRAHRHQVAEARAERGAR